MGMVTMVTNKMQACIDACSKCTQACYECFEACLNEADLNARRRCVKMLIECARMCETSVGTMSMNGDFAKQHCSMCADVCDACARECSMFKMTIANPVQTYAECVLTNAGKCLICNN